MSLTIQAVNAMFAAAAPDRAQEPRAPKHYTFSVPLRARLLCAWVPVPDKPGVQQYRWFVPETHRTERRQRVLSRWALRKRERAMRSL